MGQAKNRGPFETRKEEAIIKNKENQEKRLKIKREKKERELKNERENPSVRKRKRKNLEKQLATTAAISTIIN
jgi:hypothetical protein